MTLSASSTIGDLVLAESISRDVFGQRLPTDVPQSHDGPPGITQQQDQVLTSTNQPSFPGTRWRCI